MKRILFFAIALLNLQALFAQDCTVAATLPYNEDFSTGTPDCWEYENTDAQAPEWTFNEDTDIDGDGTNDPIMTLLPTGTGAIAKDDWAFTQKVQMEEGTNYDISVSYNSLNLGPFIANENFELVITDGITSDDVVEVLGTYNDILQQGTFPGNNDGNDLESQAYLAEVTFSPLTSGDYYVAIHATGSSGTDAGGFLIFNIGVEEGTAGCTTATVPYFEEFETEPACFVTEDTDETLPIWNYLDDTDIDGDGNGDPIYATISPGVQFPSKDDWLFSDKIQLDAGTTYYISTHYNAVDLGTTTSNEDFEFYILDAANSGAGFQELLNTYSGITQQGLFPGVGDGNDIEAQAYLAEEAFTPASTGEYYIGIRSTGSATNGGGFMVFDVAINLEPMQPDCSEAATVPYYEDFSNGTPVCWEYENSDMQAPEWTFNNGVDIDGDGSNDQIMNLIPSGVGVTAKDDWAFTKAITIVGGTEYQIEIDYNALNLGNAVASENFELVITDGPESTDVVEVLGTYEDILQQGIFPGNNDGNDLEAQAYTASELFTPTSTGEYYVAIHATGTNGTEAGGFLVFDVDVSIYVEPSDGELITIPGANFISSVNYNGSAAAGFDATTHFIWLEESGYQTIGGVVPAPEIGGQTSISDNGATVAASALNTDSGLIEMSLYDISTETWTHLGGLGGQDSAGETTSAHNISGDGSTVVGLGYTAGDNLPHAVRWQQETGVVDLGSTVPGAFSRANATDLDGDIVGGWQDSQSGFRQGAVWIDGEQTLITTNNGDPLSSVETVSNNGMWAGGEGSFANNFQAYRWSEDTGLESLGPPTTPGFRGFTSGLNEDASIAVGSYRPQGLPAVFGEGFIWTEATGVVKLNEYATSLGIDLQGMQLTFPMDISADGSTIVGAGLDSNDQRVGFILKLAPTVLGTSEVTSTIEVMAYPNPMTNQVTVQANTPLKNIEMYSVTGQQVFSKKVTSSKEVLDVSSLSNGIYFLRASDENSSTTLKVIKQ